MNKTEFVKAISDEVAFAQTDCAQVVDSMIKVIVDTLKKGEEVNITGFGKFVARDKAAKEGINPKTGEKINIAARKAPAFKAGKAFKDGIQ